MLFLQLLQRQIRSRLVVTHVVIPRLGELQELGLLSSLDVLQLLLLGRPNIVLLSNGFFLEQLVELAPGLLCLLIVTLDLALLAVLLEKTKEVEDFVVSRNIDDAVVVGLHLEILAILVSLVILSQVILYLLHKFEEVVEVYLVQVQVFVIILLLGRNFAPLLLLLLPEQVLSDLDEDLFGLVRISLKTLHDGLQVFYSYQP